MPFTPYHFGPNGFVGLIFRRWLDLPVIVGANVIIDIEVLIINAAIGHAPHHRYMHTLLIGGIAGALWGLAAYSIKPLRKLFQWAMRELRLDYKPRLLSMVSSGILGAWLHVLFDAVYHYDVAAFWPWKRYPTKSVWRLLNQDELRIACLIFWALLIVTYTVILWKKRKGTTDGLANH